MGNNSHMNWESTTGKESGNRLQLRGILRMPKRASSKVWKWIEIYEIQFPGQKVNRNDVRNWCQRTRHVLPTTETCIRMWICYHHFILISYSRRLADRHHLSFSSFTWRTADNWTRPHHKHEFNARSCHSMSSGVHFYKALIRTRGIVDVVPQAESGTIIKHELNIWIRVDVVESSVWRLQGVWLQQMDGETKFIVKLFRWLRVRVDWSGVECSINCLSIKNLWFFPGEMAVAVLPNCNYPSDGFRLITWRHSTSMFSWQHNHKRNMITSKLYEKVIGHRERTRVLMVRPIILLFEFSLEESSVIPLEKLIHGLRIPPFMVQLRYIELSFHSKH